MLHIASWYPSRHHTHKAPFAKEHIDALNRHCRNYVVHLEVIHSDKHLLKFVRERISDYEEDFLCYTRIRKLRITELITFFMLMYELIIKKKAKGYDLINLFLAYPLGLYINNIRRITRKTVTITEHWSAYHFNFNLDKDHRGLNRIRRIFKKNAPLITVSDALAEDIRNFSGNKDLTHSVVFNVVSSEVFYNKGFPEPEKARFLMVSLWGGSKNPFIVIDAFELFVKHYPDAILNIGGDGPLLPKIERAIKEKGIEKNVRLLGLLSKTEIADELNKSTALLHGSYYETFSVICAESICCGTPVIASNVGGIRSFINESNGILLDNETPARWLEAMLYITAKKSNFDRARIAADSRQQFSVEKVGRDYYNIFKEILQGKNEGARQ